MDPVDESEELKYRAYGKVDFLAGKKVARTGGAGGPIQPVRGFEFSLPIAA